MTTDRPTPKFAQVCAVARAMLEVDLSLSDGEWAELIKGRLLRLGFNYGEKGAITGAMAAVSRQVKRPPPEERRGASPPPPPPPISQDEAKRMVTMIRELFERRSQHE